jgi:hypothetical protein
MRPWSILLIGSLIAAAMVGCGGPQQGGSGAVADDICPTVSPGPPAVCPDGCDWNGTVCKKKEGIIMDKKGDPPPSK